MAFFNTVVLCNRLLASAFKETGTLGTLMHDELPFVPYNLVRYYSILRSRRTIICSSGPNPCCDSLSFQHAWEKTTYSSAVVSTESGDPSWASQNTRVTVS